MDDIQYRFKPGQQLSARSVLLWRIAQAAVWLTGAVILFCLLFFPPLGVLLFWNILIPVAPALFVVAMGVWRNVCPLATTNLLPRHLGVSKRKKLTAAQQGKLSLVAVLALYIIVPLRHAVFNNNGTATGIMIIIMAAVGVTLSFIYEWKSAWCSGLCPVHPVEKLYGGNTIASIPNAHCSQCMNCVIPCPDSTPNIHPQASVKTVYNKWSGLLIIGGLPGFIWGWFHVPDEAGITSISGALAVYKMPLLGMAVTLAVYEVLTYIIPVKYETKCISLFAAAGVSCYYWYRIPALFGFGTMGNDGLLVNLRNTVPQWSITAAAVMAAGFFFYWLVIRPQNKKSWVIRPPFAARQKMQEQEAGI